MEARIQKWGNSLGIRIPMNIIRELSLKTGSKVEIEKETDRIVIRPKEEYDLDKMIEEISAGNLHKEVDFGTEEGNEIW
ncbi:MAG: AbrB/MazE/SpoVT family DNA-binding domain-containing protein [Spirochaetota bacterium]|nr:AbrB/MazE/SpoVT family DNA-binding domain-containing protein [Spirochaetota bacterium]